ncbi:MAG: FtsX-like permease family protein [Desulfobacterales bacterium]|nr:FtsX-like permease family protein [Desulfobacterales bacterium]
MIWFLFKGLVRDRHRSLFPMLVVIGGVFITVLMHCFLRGMHQDLTSTNAVYDTGHVKIMTRGYAELSDQAPNDLCLFDVEARLSDLRKRHPDMIWTPRVKFSGLLDIPDENGETRAQGPALGMAMDLLSPDSPEKKMLRLPDAVVRGRLPRSPMEIVISEKFARGLDVGPGSAATLIGATINGGMAVQNFIVTGTVEFGVAALDRNAILAHLPDIQYALDMEDGAGEILGFFPDMIYREKAARVIVSGFNARWGKGDGDELSPVMRALSEQNGLGELLEMMDAELFIILFGLIFVMSIVLWNTGLMAGLRRRGEIGVRLAIGESKGRVYREMLYESFLIGFLGSIVGAGLGVGLGFYIQKYGIDVSGMVKAGSMLRSNIVRTHVTSASFFIGLIPGILATFFGAVIAGLEIFRRQTAQLFKELEA